jgi:hypothetical protein
MKLSRILTTFILMLGISLGREVLAVMLRLPTHTPAISGRARLSRRLVGFP